MKRKNDRKLSVILLAVVLGVLGVFKFGLWVNERATIARAHEAAQIQVEALFKAPVLVAPLALPEKSDALALYEEPEQEDPSKRIYIRQQKCLAHMVDGEAGDQKSEGKLAAAHVGYARAVDNTVEWGGNDLCNVVCKHSPGRWQFDGAKSACLNKMRGEPSESGMDAAYKVMSGEYKPDGCLARARYFMNPDISGDHGALWMLRESKYCRSIDGHAFFEPRKRNTTIAKAQHRRGHARPMLEASASAGKSKFKIAHR